MRGVLGGLTAPFLSRADWGAESAAGWRAEFSPVRGVVVHHTHTRNDDPDPLATARRIQHFHATTRGWGDIGYNFLVLEDGRVLEGRAGSAACPAPLGVVAGHAFGHNVGTLGIALVGSFHDCAPTPAAWVSLVDLVTGVAHGCGIAGLDDPVALVNGRLLPAAVCGHQDVRTTTCPGAVLAGMFPELRRQVAQGLGPVSLPA